MKWKRPRAVGFAMVDGFEDGGGVMPEAVESKSSRWQLKYFWNVHPENWGKIFQLDERIFENR